MNSRCFFTICALAIGVACTPTGLSSLERIDFLMSERPDSALALLQRIDNKSLRTEREKALYSLLLSKALDKNYIDLTSDSLIRPAVDYYENGKDHRRAAESLFYLGRVHYNAGDDNAAIVSFMRALDAASTVDDPVLEGLIELSVALSYNHSYNNEDELEYAKASLRSFERSGNQYYIDNARYYVAMSLHNNSRWQEAEALYDSLIVTPGVDSSIVAVSLVELADMCIEGPDSVRQPSKSVSLYEKAISDNLPMTAQNWSKYAYALYLDGYKEQSREILRQLGEMAQDDSAFTYNCRYLIKKHDGYYKEALELLEKADALQEAKIIERMRQTSARTMRDYYSAQSQIEEARAERNRVIIIALIITGLIIAMIVVLFIRKRTKKHKQEMFRLLAIAEESKRMQQEADLRVEEELQKNGSLQKRVAMTRHLFRKAFHAEFKEIGDLAQDILVYDQNNEKEYVKEKLYLKANSLAMTLSGKNRDFERKLNDYLDDVMAKIRKDLPGLPEKHYKIISLSISGLDANYISLLLDRMSVDMVYRIKSDARTKLLRMDSKNHELYSLLL